MRTMSEMYRKRCVVLYAYRSIRLIRPIAAQMSLPAIAILYVQSNVVPNLWGLTIVRVVRDRKGS